ncbi:MAG: hypothetical protein R3199_02140 [Gemmatimonadota bacterium]|nr:hypothetical protein [Gemmatimonadota bacterium]
MIRTLSPLFAGVALVALSAAPGVAQQARVDLDDPERPEEDRLRDEFSKPLAMLEWAGLEEGDVALDFHAGAGYNTWVLSEWVGPEGVVFTEMSGRRAEALKERLATGDLADAGNVVYVDALAKVPDDTLDLFLTVRNYHDIPVDRIPEFLAGVERTLRPGGLFVVVDARTDEGRDVDAHRIADEVIVEEVTAAGFELLGSSELLANPEDDHAGPRWERREQVDQSLLKFRVPAEGGR